MRYFIVGVGALAIASQAQSQAFGPSPYLKYEDSPFFTGTWDYFHLETFEDDLLNVPGVTKDNGNPYGPASNCDSVDGDDGVIDGLGTAGHSFFNSSGNAGVTFTFNAGVLGMLPTHAGVVWTDGAGTITFEAWDQNNISLGTIIGSHADGSFNGTTGEDRFYGWANAGGISKIKIKNSSGGIELDHLQYGHGVVPEPATMTALSLACAALLKRRKRA